MEASTTQARILVVAHRTAATPALIAAVRERAVRGPAEFTLLVPAAAHGLDRLAEPDQIGSDEAQDTLDLALPLLEEAAGGRVGGIIGGAQPLDAVTDAVNQHGFDEIIISTLSPRVSRWLRMDVPNRLKVLGKPITTVSASGASAT
ncbi:MAG: hypothetical protein H0V22_09285 [Solirubrobacterales bacterium]|nr:hypothetical protein [Solirubrobacterales bacterium]